jgi:cytochrome c1
MVGPPLDGIALRTIIAGHLANTPDSMQHWIRDPQHVSPGTAMPDLHVGEQDARDITAFLYTRAK